jgi:benzoyl-CoA-dihydrodiol lyase
LPNGLPRLQTRFLGEPARIDTLRQLRAPLNPKMALTAGLVTFTPDAIDFDDELRLALEERAAISPDALTGMEANLRFAGPETLETKIFGRLSAWQNWIFTRPNATGEKGALTLYGKSGTRPDFDLRRT